MNYTFEIGLTLKWGLIGALIIVVSWILGSIIGWDVGNPISFICGLFVVVGLGLIIVMTIIAIIQDFEEDNKKKQNSRW